jgi:uncharacterized membrane protein YqjE
MVAALPEAHDVGLITSVGRLSRSLLAHFRMRLQLLGLELEQEKERILIALLAILLAYLFLTVTLLFAALAIIVHFWDTPDRMASIVWMAVVSALVTAGCVTLAVQKLGRPSTLFHASLAELVEDEEALATPAVATKEELDLGA